ncbi:tRNA threonylcarbamoyladenosine dehydratase [Pedosphaera parvula]|uniref:UBA/THIF-type NAD/FAD binding protein n=1 Tax=Pedosphaera parvula (strain Ellin514) TaxID=320771 RepID=B9XDN1_PEDPL|nr:tRNA threonylcarbamoyladenosine dehydratase [Pedosphaera parvula]EEF62177.1 UBA/THIF-type NAD/FAD binding protein [Pedosphaera parvula Ellin514]
MSQYEERFGGIGRLYSAAGLERIRSAHVCVIGIGGVGSWAVEALARSGTGELTLIDLDEVCVSNVNRQLHALDGEIGKSKVEVMARRTQAINPECKVHAVNAFFTESNAQEILATRFDYVLDAIDSSSKKCLMIALCRDKGIPIITTGAAGGRRNPAAIQLVDLTQSTNDRLLRETRSKLRTRHGFPRGEKKFNVACVCSTELPVYPSQDGSVCPQPEPGTDHRLNCSSGFGSATFVTGAFAFLATAHIVHEIAQREK